MQHTVTKILTKISVIPVVASMMMFSTIPAMAETSADVKEEIETKEKELEGLKERRIQIRNEILYESETIEKYKSTLSNIKDIMEQGKTDKSSVSTVRNSSSLAENLTSITGSYSSASYQSLMKSLRALIDESVEEIEKGKEDIKSLQQQEADAQEKLDNLNEKYDELVAEEEAEAEKQAEEERKQQDASYTWSGSKLTASAGINYGPSGKETYYNMDMSGVVSIMRSMGNTDEYWVRADGCKMLGDYIIVAANLDVHPRGSLVETSLGMGIVCDTGGFASGNPTQLDIAVTW